MSAAEAQTNEERPERRIGSYRLLQPLGSGGMSSVFRADHVETGLEVAVKILPKSLAKNPPTLQRFLREAKSAEALEHPNIVAIYDRGVDQGRYYLVLEYVRGGDLHDWVRVNGPMPADRALNVIRQVVEGLRYAAGQGVIHRDIKPANLLLSESGQVKVTDLGLAIHSVDEDERVTREGTTVGTVDYMSPEQARDSRATSVRSDMYSLGCTFFFLLTGKPPYQGGDVVEKLARHCTAPPVDPRSIRPEVPAAVAEIVMTMSAKRPEKRFADYDGLLKALDRAEGVAPETGANEAPLDALIVEDDEEGPDSAVLLTLAEPVAPPSKSSKKAAEVPAPRAEVSMADLAELDALTVTSPKKPDRPPAVTPSQTPIRRGEGLPAAEAAARFDEEDDELALAGTMPGAFHGGSARKMTAAERSWITGLVLGGLGLIVMVIAVDQLIKASRTEEVAPVTQSEEGSTTLPPIPVPVDVAKAPVVAPPKPVEKATRPVSKNTETPAAVVAKPIYVEPSDPTVEMVTEAPFPPGTETSFRPGWAASEIVTRLSGKLTVVRRFPDASDVERKSSLRAALDIAGSGTIEVADNGPFFENDLHFGDPRIIRARPGFRPIICITRPKNEEAGAFLELGERSLTLEGVDLVVDVTDLPRNLSLFGCGGGALTLLNCTVTVVNRNGAPFSLVTTRATDQPSRLRFERCVIRGAFLAFVELSKGAADIVVSRSLLLNGLGVGFSVDGSPTESRGLFISRSICATRGPLIEMSDTQGGAKSRPLAVRALGNLFAHFETPAKTSLMVWRGAGGTAAEMVGWRGDRNSLRGWSDWLSVASGHSIRVADVVAARSVWSGTDPNTTEESVTWPLPPAPERVAPDDLRGPAKGRLDTLARAPAPSPYLLSRTIEPFRNVIVPSVETRPNDAVKPIPNGTTTTGGLPRRAAGPMPAGPMGPNSTRTDRSPPGGGPAATSNVTLADGIREISFDTESAPLFGDIGKLLTDSVRAGDRLVRVKVSGATRRAWTPFRMPAGVSLEVLVSPNGSGQSPSWTSPRGVAAEALIDVSNAGLLLEGVVLERDGSAILKHLIRVERGHLVLQDCQLRGPSKSEPGGGKLIAFVAPGSQLLEPFMETGTKPADSPPSIPRFGPAPKAKSVAPTAPPVPHPWPFATIVNRPTLRASDCVLISGGTAIEAGVGRGLVALLNCVVISGGTAFALNPTSVARSRFDADLYLDHCSIAAERSFVSLGAWPGSDPGPDRPWLVTTHKSAFLAAFERPEAPSVLLQAEPTSLAHGTLFWQASGDAFEVPNFISTAGRPALPSTGNPRRLDVNQNWAKFWGESHFRNVIGPTGPSGLPSVRPSAPLRPGDVEASDLILDSKYPAGRPHRELGADFSRLGINPASRGGRRR